MSSNVVGVKGASKSKSGKYILVPEEVSFIYVIEALAEMKKLKKTILKQNQKIIDLEQKIQLLNSMIVAIKNTNFPIPRPRPIPFYPVMAKKQLRWVNK